LHIRPRLFCPFKNVALVDLTIEPLGLQLVGGVDLATGRPYPNKRYTVAYRKRRRKAIDGILIETANPIEEVRYTARWTIEAELLVTHRVLYRVLDHDFDAASDNTGFWHSYSAELGGWTNRFPAGEKGLAPAAVEPMMEVVSRDFERHDTEDEIDDEGRIIERRQNLGMPTIGRARLLDTNINERMPSLDDAFRVNVEPQVHHDAAERYINLESRRAFRSRQLQTLRSC
jgi:hypothetical protein